MIPAEAWRSLAEARRLDDAGRRDEAVVRLREVVREQPRFVSAHRALQNAMLADHRRGELLGVYRALRDAEPRSAERWYLWGRIQSDPTAQRAAFEHAETLDSGSPWPCFGLAMVAHGDGDAVAARRWLDRARQLAPDVPDFEVGEIRVRMSDPATRDRAAMLAEGSVLDEPWDVERVLLLAECRERAGRSRESLELLGRLLARFPGHAEVTRRLLVRLEASATVTDVTWLSRELALVADQAQPALVMARCHAMLGDAGGALSAWEQVPALDAATRALRRLLLVLRGESSRALALEAVRITALERLGADVSAYAAAVRLAAECDAARAAGVKAPIAAVVGLAESWLALGAADEALAVLRPLRGTGDLAVGALAARLEQLRHLEAELKVLAIENYRSVADHGGTGLEFDALLAAIDGAARRTAGAPAISAAPHLSIWPLGELIDPTAGGLPQWFAEGGRLLVAGRRTGLPGELFVAPVVARGEAGPQRARLHWIEGTLIPGWLEHQGARFAGAALDRFAWIDVAALEDEVADVTALAARLGREGVARVRADPIEPARDRAERCAIVEPGEVAAKLSLAALASWRGRELEGDPAALLHDALDAVLCHESAHLADAQRFLPFSRKLWGELPMLFRLGFSPRRIEEWLELRAQCAALATARNPWFVLADCAAALGGGDGLTPHGEGYRELLARLVALVDAAPDDFPQLDRGAVLLQQLDRLTLPQLRLAARRLAVELDLEVADPPLSSPRAAAR